MLALAVLAALIANPGPNPALVHHAVSTKVAAAQQKFDEGLTLIYAFNRKEARKRFEESATLDPTLAMAWWGVALGVGPNINEEMSADDLSVARDALAKAKALETGASPEERRYIDALAVRYPATVKDATYPPYTAYRGAMKSVAADYPDDLDASVLYAESIMDVEGAPFVDGVQSADDATVAKILSAVLARDSQHIGANHYLIHAWDRAGRAAPALPSANYLSGLSYEPADSHLQHMPGHTYLDVGDFSSLENVGRLSSLLDDAYAKTLGVEPFTLEYHRHDLDFWAGGALMLDDRGEIDQSTAEYKIAGNTGAMLIYARERDYVDLDAFPKPKVMGGRALVEWHYARFLSALARSDIAGATRESSAIDKAIRERLEVAPIDVPIGALVHGRLAHALGDDASAVTLLKRALDETKDDPPESFAPWFYPAGEWLGDIYLQRGDLAGAEAAFRKELERIPNDARVMYGLMRTLTREGRLDDARALAPKIAANWSGDPVDLHAPDI
jgi:tetratricopeptide (TPR) repeat protein